VPDLDQAVKSLTGDIHQAADHESRLKILLDVEGIGLPMASAILAVLYPDDFTVYDTRVCNSWVVASRTLGGARSETIHLGQIQYEWASWPDRQVEGVRTPASGP